MRVCLWLWEELENSNSKNMMPMMFYERNGLRVTSQNIVWKRQKRNKKKDDTLNNSREEAPTKHVGCMDWRVLMQGGQHADRSHRKHASDKKESRRGRGSAVAWQQHAADAYSKPDRRERAQREIALTQQAQRERRSGSTPGTPENACKKMKITCVKECWGHDDLRITWTHTRAMAHNSSTYAMRLADEATKATVQHTRRRREWTIRTFCTIALPYLSLVIVLSNAAYNDDLGHGNSVLKHVRRGNGRDAVVMGRWMQWMWWIGAMVGRRARVWITVGYLMAIR